MSDLFDIPEKYYKYKWRIRSRLISREGEENFLILPLHPVYPSEYIAVQERDNEQVSWIIKWKNGFAIHSKPNLRLPLFPYKMKFL